VIWPWGVIAYSVVAFAALRPITGHFAWTFCRNYNRDWYHKLNSPNGDQWFGAFCLAVVVVTLWPLAVLWCISDRTIPTVGNERIARLEADRKRLRQMEKELGI
jgi:hypothetical protein